jgi:hypothetical protein
MSESQVEFPVQPPSDEAQAIAKSILASNADSPIVATPPNDEALAMAREISETPPGEIARIGARAPNPNPQVEAMKKKMFRRE